VIDELAARGILIRSPPYRGVAEEAPEAYKDLCAVMAAADRTGLSRYGGAAGATDLHQGEPLICIKGWR
jgi:tRNA-splicing ligase RtcB